MSDPRIHDPRAVPIVGTGADQPPVPVKQLNAAALRQRFLTPPAWQPEMEGDGGRFADREPASAAVLIPLVMREEGLQILLTRRTAHLRSHAGQISFPGGRVEQHDVDATATALRETCEEIGLGAPFIEVIGQLPVYCTVTAFQVTPVVALVQPGFELKLDAFEVDEAFEVPVQFLMDPAHHQRHRFEVGSHTRHFYSMPWNDYFIWGATAAMLRNLYRFLSA
ncbi:MAG TPA: CoA pyrophosphatase [Burkholderiaceae bacterium]|jgi:8-oxo-dGTP pyrophosphatase MutT (NUDIX family)